MLYRLIGYVSGTVMARRAANAIERDLRIGPACEVGPNSGLSALVVVKFVVSN